jgi:hypothetical protein
MAGTCNLSQKACSLASQFPYVQAAQKAQIGNQSAEKML